MKFLDDVMKKVNEFTDPNKAEVKQLYDDIAYLEAVTWFNTLAQNIIDNEEVPDDLAPEDYEYFNSLSESVKDRLFMGAMGAYHELVVGHAALLSQVVASGMFEIEYEGDDDEDV